jgi:hypothetical protein
MLDQCAADAATTRIVRNKQPFPQRKPIIKIVVIPGLISTDCIECS